MNSNGKNLVGVRATLTFTDDETQGGPGCAVAQSDGRMMMSVGAWITEVL